VLTCSGRSFAARVAGSQLAALGLHELIVDNLSAYESVALDLASSPVRFTVLRDKLARGRAALFDTPKLCRELESAYQKMWDIHKSGAASKSFDVPAGG
jgi:predicted O-linked N-acetylglucosamine transferase (SPINDLY family)